MNNGGPAFPCPVGHIKCEHPEGMTLRDYFAAQALPTCISNTTPEDVQKFGSKVYPMVAETAYAFADAMLKARGR